MPGSDLAIRNANIVTVHPAKPRAEALAIQDGRLVAVGTWDEVSPHARDMPLLDLAGKTIVPGLIDTHVHLLWTALSLAALDAGAGVDHDSLQAILRLAVSQATRGELIFGMGYREYALDAGEFSPIVDVLDAIAPENPVYLVGVTGHSSAANRQALAMLDLPEGTPGIRRDAQGQPTGVLTDRANSRAGDFFAQQFGGGDRAAAQLTQAVEKAHSVGITTLHALEGGLTGQDEAVTDLIAAIPDLSLRVVLYYQTMDVDRVLALGLPRIGGCILLDGDVGPHTAALSEPYADDPACYGTLYHNQDEIDAFVLRAHKAGLQVAMHAVGDAAVEQALNAYEAALAGHTSDDPSGRARGRDHRHRIEHCEIIREDQIQRAHRLGVALAIQPPFNHYWPHTTYYPLLGEERAWKADPVRTLLRPGLLVAGGSDSTVTPLGPLIGVHAAVNHSNPAERTGVREGLELYTINAARIAFEEGEKGSLETGKLGDLVVLAEDPLRIEPAQIKEIPVEMTVVGGQIVYER